MSLIFLSLVLFLIMDPLGNVQSFVKYTDGINPKRKNFIIVRELLIALATMLIFNFLGEVLMELLKISQETIYLASAMILFLTAIKIIFPSEKDTHVKKVEEEPFLVPLAIPMTAGPSLLATIMLYAEETNSFVMFTAIIIAWTISSIILMSSHKLLKMLGPGGLTACEKLMGMVLVLVSIQRALSGILIFNSNAQ